MAGQTCWTFGQQAADCQLVLLSEHDSYYFKTDEEDVGPEESNMSDMLSHHLCVRISTAFGS